VTEAQTAISNQAPVNANTPILSNLSMDGKAWFIHPVVVKVFKGNSCFCNRNFTVEEVKKIVKLLRSIDKLKTETLFTLRNCNLPIEDKTYERFTNELNSTLNKYDINSCLRKSHFLAQVYLETMGFQTTTEMSLGDEYNPGRHPNAQKNGNIAIGDGPKYKGRGLMQLTWKKNYVSYFKFSGIDVVTNYLWVSDKLSYAVDSAGWYWRYGSVWGDLNSSADKDDIYLINIAINGGVNGFAERIRYLKQLIEFMDIHNCKEVNIDKKLGKYSLMKSALQNTKYGRKNKIKLEVFDD
jgi:predicted chitinase